MTLNKETHTYNRKFYLGCVGISVLAFALLVALVSFLFRQVREDAYYPNGRLLSSHSNYNALPQSFKWEESFRTTDEVPQILNFYSQRYGLGAEAAAMSACTYLEGETDNVRLRRFIGVFICESPQGQTIYVSRTFYRP